METADTLAQRRESIASALRAELQRQSVQGIDIEALVQAVDTALAEGGTTDEGHHPAELNASNDD